MTSFEKPLIRIKKSIRGDTQASVSEFTLATAPNEKVDLGRLVGVLNDVKAAGDLKKQLTTANKRNQTLNAPLHKQAKERIERKIAYDETKKRVGVWDEVVRQNRLSDKLVFPLNQKSYSNTTLEKAIERFEPRTELEIETAKILGASKNNLTGKMEYTEAEKELLQSLSLEEAEKRKEKLCKMRALMTYEQAKGRRKRNIKSKRYHRISKKQKRKEVEQQFLNLLRTNPQLAREKLEQLETDRAKERSTLKHRSTGKWAKQIRRFAQKDPELREALQTQLRLGKELAEKIAQPDSEDDSDDSDTEQTTGHVDNNADKPANRSITVDLTPKLAEVSAETLGIGTDEQTDLIAEAFADDDVIEAERAEEMNYSDGDNDIKASKPEGQLPGWNSWTGPGIKPKAQKSLSKKAPKNQALKKRNYVEKANESVNKYRVKQIPFPFCSRDVFEANLSYPLGREWNPETAFKMLVEPNVRTKMGAIIKPIDKSFILKNKKQNFKKQKFGGESTEEHDNMGEHILL